MKKLLSFVCIAFALTANAQPFPGATTGNNAGVNGILSNPASIADSRFRFDLNLFSFQTNIGTDKIAFGNKDLKSSPDTDFFLDQLKSGSTNGMINIDLLGPSLMFNTGKKSAMAISTRVRGIASLRNIDGNLLKQVSDGISDGAGLPYNFALNTDMKAAVNSWTELGITYSREIYSKGANYLKAGVTIKYLGGISGGYLRIAQLKGSLREDAAQGDAYFANTTGQIGLGLSRSNFDDFSATDFNSTGIGADLGLVYEYRPEFEKYAEDKKSNKYKLRIGASILDLGKLKGKNSSGQGGNYSVDVTGNEKLKTEEFDDIEFENFNKFFSTRPQYFTSLTNIPVAYRYSLPTTFQLNVDYHCSGGFYLNLAGQLPLQKENMSKPYDNRFYSSVVLTPRIEAKRMGFYLPLQYSALTGLNAGASLSMGPLFIGSSSIVKAIYGKTKQVDLQLGLKLSFYR